MVCNKKRIIIVALTFVPVWTCMTFVYFTISFHKQERPSEVQNVPTRANTTPTVITAAVKYQTDINETDDSDMNETLHQLIDFKDLGRNKRAVLLLIIVSTAPARFERRQAIRETWWKHCSDGNQAQVGRQDRLFIIITSYLTMTLFLVIHSEISYRRRRCRRCDDDGNKQISTALDYQNINFPRASHFVFCMFIIVAQ